MRLREAQESIAQVDAAVNNRFGQKVRVPATLIERCALLPRNALHPPMEPLRADRQPTRTSGIDEESIALALSPRRSRAGSARGDSRRTRKNAGTNLA